MNTCLKISGGYSRLASQICTHQVHYKYATLRQLKFQKDCPRYELQEKIRNLELQFQCLGKTRMAERQEVEHQLAPLYKEIMRMVSEE